MSGSPSGCKESADVWEESGAEADVRVHIRAGIIAIEREHTSVRGVVPVAATIREPPIIGLLPGKGTR
ncbi:hypothetical protein FACS1894184_14150 [Clostridia bacterium]|nr:hypothetical protein FACS1894184_14150 [Clostridia bacterium]